MLRKMTIVSLCLLMIGFLWTAPAKAASVVGEWDVTGTMTVTLTVPGYGSESVTAGFYDFFVFYANGDFEMIDMWGTWSQNKKKFTVWLDTDAMEWYFEEALYADVSVTKAKFTGKIGNNISGTFQINMTINFYGVQGKVAVKGVFVGYRAGQNVPQTQAPKEPAKPVLDGILDFVAPEK